jgi:hypothetical protein
VGTKGIIYLSKSWKYRWKHDWVHQSSNPNDSFPYVFNKILHTIVI